MTKKRPGTGERKTKGQWRQGLPEETWEKTTAEGINRDKKETNFIVNKRLQQD